MRALWEDLRFSVRSLRKHALLSTVVIATLTLGVGFSAGIFTLINALFLRARVRGWRPIVWNRRLSRCCFAKICQGVLA